MEKTTTIELEFSSVNNYECSVTLTRKGKVETTVFEMGRKEVPGRNSRGEELHFHFKGDRLQLTELGKFISTILQESYEELHPEEAKRHKALAEKEAADVARESWEKS